MTPILRFLRIKRTTTASLLVLGLGANLALAQVSLLHSFTGGTDGSQPLGTLALSGTNLYGMATSGGAKNYGTIFKVSTDGGSFALLHTFTNGATSAGHSMRPDRTA